MRYSESKSWRQKVERWLPGPRGERKMGSWPMDDGLWLHNNMNTHIIPINCQFKNN